VRRVAIALLVCAGAAGVVVAQSDDDPQLRDHERQDRRYVERQQRGEAAPDDEDADAYIARADELIRDRNYRSGSGPSYRVQTDDPRLRPQAAVDLLTRFREFFERTLGERIELKPHDVQARTFLFYSFHKYNRMLGGDFSRRIVRPSGHYGAVPDVLVVHTDAGPTADFADTLIHEAAHHLVAEEIYGDAGRPAPWLSEGLASYFGYTFLDATGAFEPGVIGGKSVELFLKGGARPGTGAKRRLRTFRKDLRSRGPETELTFDWVASIRDRASFYGADVRITYPASWLLVHYLLHGDGGSHAPAFLRFVALDVAGQATPEALYRELGMDAATLDAAVRAYVKDLHAK